MVPDDPLSFPIDAGKSLGDLNEEGEVKSMYATVRRYEGVTDPGEATRRVNEGFVQLVSRLPGFIAYYCIDAGAGVMISASVFENQASAEDSDKRAADYIRENLVTVLPNPPQITAGEVVAHTTG